MGLLSFLALGVHSSDASGSEARVTPMVTAVKRAAPSVVNIHSEKLRGGKISGMGSGIIIDERGYIVTNQHVIADVDTLRVTLMNGSTYQARIISFDRKHDLALLKIDSTETLPVIQEHKQMAQELLGQIGGGQPS